MKARLQMAFTAHMSRTRLTRICAHTPRSSYAARKQIPYSIRRHEGAHQRRFAEVDQILRLLSSIPSNYSKQCAVLPWSAMSYAAATVRYRGVVRSTRAQTKGRGWAVLGSTIVHF